MNQIKFRNFYKTTIILVFYYCLVSCSSPTEIETVDTNPIISFNKGVKVNSIRGSFIPEKYLNDNSTPFFLKNINELTYLSQEEIETVLDFWNDKDIDGSFRFWYLDHQLQRINRHWDENHYGLEFIKNNDTSLEKRALLVIEILYEEESILKSDTRNSSVYKAHNKLGLVFKIEENIKYDIKLPRFELIDDEIAIARNDIDNGDRYFIKTSNLQQLISINSLTERIEKYNLYEITDHIRFSDALIVSDEKFSLIKYDLNENVEDSVVLLKHAPAFGKVLYIGDENNYVGFLANSSRFPQDRIGVSWKHEFDEFERLKFTYMYINNDKYIFKYNEMGYFKEVLFYNKNTYSNNTNYYYSFIDNNKIYEHEDTLKGYDSSLPINHRVIKRYETYIDEKYNNLNPSSKLSEYEKIFFTNLSHLNSVSSLESSGISRNNVHIDEFIDLFSNYDIEKLIQSFSTVKIEDILNSGYNLAGKSFGCPTNNLDCTSRILFAQFDEFISYEEARSMISKELPFGDISNGYYYIGSIGGLFREPQEIRVYNFQSSLFKVISYSFNNITPVPAVCNTIDYRLNSWDQDDEFRSLVSYRILLNISNNEFFVYFNNNYFQYEKIEDNPSFCE